MSLTGKEEHHRTLWIIDDTAQTIEVGKQQVSTLVGSKTTTEANNQCVGVQALCQFSDSRGIILTLEPSGTELSFNIIEQVLLHQQTSLPKHLIRTIVDTFPTLFVRLVTQQILVKIFLIDILQPTGSHPCREVNTISDVAHVVLLREVSAPDGGKHLLRYPSVQH